MGVGLRAGSTMNAASKIALREVAGACKSQENGFSILASRLVRHYDASLAAPVAIEAR